jgi:hypothetical protein
MVYDVPVAFAIGVKMGGVPSDASATHHCKMGVGMPDTLHVNVTACPIVTVCASGERINAGAAAFTVSSADALVIPAGAAAFVATQTYKWFVSFGLVVDRV